MILSASLSVFLSLWFGPSAVGVRPWMGRERKDSSGERDLHLHLINSIPNWPDNSHSFDSIQPHFVVPSRPVGSLLLSH